MTPLLWASALRNGISVVGRKMRKEKAFSPGASANPSLAGLPTAQAVCGTGSGGDQNTRLPCLKLRRNSHVPAIHLSPAHLVYQARYSQGHLRKGVGGRAQMGTG